MVEERAVTINDDAVADQGFSSPDGSCRAKPPATFIVAV